MTNNIVELKDLHTKSLLTTKSFNGMAVDENGIRIHKHIILTAAVNNPPTTEEEVVDWLREMVGAVNMNILSGPVACTSNVVGNEGITGTVIIDTSHIAMHMWNGVSPAIIELDIFSCKDYEVSVPIQFLKRYDLQAINFRCVDRTNKFEDLKLYVVYRTTNMVNNKIYIGVHSCYNMNYDYLGSGIHLKSAIKKYGRENFSHEVLHVFTNEDDAYAKEAELVDEEFVARKDTYNKVVGGVRPQNRLSDREYHRNKRWVNNGVESKVVLVEDLPHALLAGWQLGKTPKKPRNSDRAMSLEQRNLRAKKWVFLSPQSVKTEIFNLAEFCSQNDLSVYGMYDVYSGKQLTHRGWTKYNGKD